MRVLVLFEAGVEELGDEFLDVFLHFLFGVFLLFEEKVVKSGAAVTDLTLLISNTGDSGIFYFVFFDIGDKEQLISSGGDSALQLEEDGEDVAGFIFTIEGALVAVDFFVSVLEEDFEVVVVLLGEDFGHDFIDFDVFEVFFGVVEDGAGLGVDHGHFAQFVLGEGQGD